MRSGPGPAGDFITAAGRADRSRQRHRAAGRGKGQTRPAAAHPYSQSRHQPHHDQHGAPRAANSLVAAHVRNRDSSGRLRAARQRHRRGVRREPHRPTRSMACSRSTNTNKRQPQRPLDPHELAAATTSGRGRNLVGGWAGDGCGESSARQIRPDRRAGQVEAVGAVERFLGRAGENCRWAGLDCAVAG